MTLAHFQFEVVCVDGVIPIAISPLLDEATAIALFEHSAVGPGYELLLHYRGVLVRRRDASKEYPLGKPVDDEDDDKDAEGAENITRSQNHLPNPAAPA